MPLPPGTRLGLYEIVAPPGAGGMGEVYRARDTRLGREVAIKALLIVLPHSWMLPHLQALTARASTRHLAMTQR
jgi:serine/threonine protein kinase